jgi:hypothetical protein
MNEEVNLAVPQAPTIKPTWRSLAPSSRAKIGINTHDALMAVLDRILIIFNFILFSSDTNHRQKSHYI